MWMAAALVCAIVALFSFKFGGRRKRSLAFVPATAALLLLVAMFTLSACGGGGGSTPPPTNKTYTLTVTGSAGNLSHSTSVQLVVD